MQYRILESGRNLIKVSGRKQLYSLSIDDIEEIPVQRKYIGES